MTRPASSAALLCALLLAYPVTPAEEFRVLVSAGAFPRRDSPVSAPVDLPSPTPESVALAVSEDTTVPAQIVQEGDAGTRIWWIVDSLAAGETRQVTLKVEPPPTGARAVPHFSWKTSPGVEGRSSELRLGERPVMSYMHTPFDPSHIELTKKVFHHVWAPDGSQRLTKGPGGLYPHHRGIFFGYRCTVGGKTYDIWHAHRGEHQVHREVVREITGPVMGGHVLHIDWNDRDGHTFAEETRTLLAFRQSSGHTLLEFRSTLRATGETVLLGGDRQHAGVQFRAAQAVAENKRATRYLRPANWADLDPGKEINNAAHRELPWNAMQFDLEGTGYTVAYLSDPDNPEGANFSERLYGRFGEFIPWELAPDRPLTLRYRWWIHEGRDVTRQDVEIRYRDLAAPVVVEVKGAQS